MSRPLEKLGPLPDRIHRADVVAPADDAGHPHQVAQHLDGQAVVLAGTVQGDMGPVAVDGQGHIAHDGLPVLASS
ncbi:hypothetical protein [Nocardia wallacei]|uniref:hypothetical protein n=1 Tax=Nocardia wallacei TaxID=480035 RepID=UPI00245434B1|nr:hypothetical protein [Nocardia wallacei]